MKRTPLAITALLAVLFISQAFAATIPAGTRVTVRITENLSSGKTKVGQLFHGALSAPIIVNGHVVYAKGSPVRGKVLAVHPSGRLSDPGVLDLSLLSVGNGHSSSTLHTQVFRVKGESHTKSNVEKIGGTTAAGTVLGAIFGGGKGAAIGAASGAAAGTTVAAATGKKEATVESEAVLAFVTANTSRAATVQPVSQERQEYADQDGDQRTYRHSERDDDEYRGDDRYRRDDRDRDDGSYRRDDRDDGYYARTFSDDDHRILQSCYSSDYSNLPPGLAKRGGKLPPGLERQLQRNGTLPPGLQKRVQPLPESCERSLPRVPVGWSRVALSGRILLLDGHARIMDMFVVYGN